MNSTNGEEGSIKHSDLLYDYQDYEYDGEAGVVPLPQLVPVAVTYGLIILLGSVGNTLVIAAVARFRNMRSITNLFLLSLATADLLIILVCAPIKVSNILYFTTSFNKCFLKCKEKQL